MSKDAIEPTPTAGASKDWLRRIEAKQVLFEEGAIDRRLFVLIDGQIDILRGGRLLAEIGVTESFIGEVSALTGKPRSATARTARASTLLVVERIEDLFQLDGTWGLRLARELARRLDRMNDRFERLQEVLDLTRQDGENMENVTTTLAAMVSGDETIRPI